MYGDLGISKEVLEYGARIEAALEDRFARSMAMQSTIS